MFKNLKKGSTIYILDKNKIEYYERPIISASEPRIDANAGGSFIAEKVVDIAFDIGGVQIDCTVLESRTFAESKDGKNSGLCISTTQDDLRTEVRSMIEERANILANVDRYKKEQKALDLVLGKVDPQGAKDKERDKRIDSLSGDVIELKCSIKEILSILKDRK